MGSIQSGLRDIFEDEERGVTTPDAVVGAMAARIRRGRAGRIAGVSAGTLTLAGFAAALPFALSQMGSPELAPGATPEVTATYLMPDNPLGLGCGDPVPSAVVAASDVSQIHFYTVAATPDEAWLELDVSTSPEPSPVSPVEVSHADYILGLDGAVVGWTSEGIDTPLWAPFTIVHLTVDDDGMWLDSGHIVVCPSVRDNAGFGSLQPGTYDAYKYDPAAM